MARHRVGEYGVEVLHLQYNADQKPDVIVIVFQDGQVVEMARFGWHGFNSAELRRRLRTLDRFSVPKLSAVIEDARCWPKDEAKAKTPMKPKPRRSSRGTSPLPRSSAPGNGGDKSMFNLPTFVLKRTSPLLIAFVLMGPQCIEAATCTGSSNCRACKNCRYCRHCNAGGTCGVCSPRSAQTRLLGRGRRTN